MEQYSQAEAFIEILNTNGVENIFINPGADTASVQAAILNYKTLGRTTPKLVLCLDESVAMSAAHGHYMVSGRPQVVMVHAELGTLQVGGAMHNAQWGRIPVILCTGILPGQRLTWRQETFEQNSIVRGCVKWDHTLGDNESITNILEQAFSQALNEPRGPVYLTYPMGILDKKIDKQPFMSTDEVVIPVTREDAEKLDDMAGILTEAQHPLIITGYTARYPELMAQLTNLAETLCAPVLSGPTMLNFPTTHPLSAGIEQIGGSKNSNPYIGEADVILAIDYDSPYVPAEGTPGQNAKILHIDVDPLTQGRPLWGRGADIFIKTDSRQAIGILIRQIQNKIDDTRRIQFDDRKLQIEKRQREEREQRFIQGETSKNEKPISPDWLCHCLAKVIDEDTVIVNHTISQSGSVTDQIERSKSGTLLGCAGGSIQWGLGASLGVKTALPDKLVINLVSDGGFVWGCPVATLWSASHYQLPFLTIVFNNQSYGVIKGLIEQKLETRLTDVMAFETGVDIVPPPDYAGVAAVCGGQGYAVNEPDEVLPVLKDAIDHVRKGKVAVVDVKLGAG